MDSLTYVPGSSYHSKLKEVDSIIRDFHGFSPMYSAREIAGSPHFRTLNPRLLSDAGEGKKSPD